MTDLRDLREALRDVADAGRRIVVDDDSLRLTPGGALAPETVDALKRHRDRLLSILRNPLVEAAMQMCSSPGSIELMPDGHVFRPFSYPVPAKRDTMPPPTPAARNDGGC